MDTWASLEHELKYKNEGALSDDLQNKLKICSEILADVDNMMENIRHEVFSEEQKYSAHGVEKIILQLKLFGC